MNIPFGAIAGIGSAMNTENRDKTDTSWRLARPTRVLLAASAFRQIAEVSLEYPTTETGGILAGSVVRVGSERAYVVRVASGPGEDAICTPGSYSPDIHYYKLFLKSMLARYGFEGIGEWHKHPGRYCTPSSRDEECVQGILASENRSEFLCLIVNSLRLSASHPLELHAYQYDPISAAFAALPVTIVDFTPIPWEQPAFRAVALTRGALQAFLESGEQAALIEGIRYDDGLARFPCLGHEVTNTRAFLVRAETMGEVTLPTAAADLFVTVKASPDGTPAARPYYLGNRGELLPCTATVFDPTADCFSRNAGIVETHALAAAHAVLLGAGSVGSVIASELAKAGVGRLTLVDPDELAPVNISRHALDLRDLGRLKVKALRDKLVSINPACDVNPVPIDATLYREEFTKAVRSAGVLIVSTDTEGSRALANEVAVKERVPAVFVTLFERAESGYVHTLIPGTTGCRRCLGRSGQDLPRGPVPYSEAASERDANIQPGISIDIGLVALLGARAAVRVLAGEHQVPLIYWKAPTSIRYVEQLPPKPECPVCGNTEATACDGDVPASKYATDVELDDQEPKGD